MYYVATLYISKAPKIASGSKKVDAGYIRNLRYDASSIDLFKTT